MKAQSSIEFMTMIGLFMVIFLTFFAVLGDRMVAFNTKRQADLADDMLYYVESEILMAAQAHDGFYRQFTLPSKLGGEAYNLTLNVSAGMAELTIHYLELEYGRPILINLTNSSYLEPLGSMNWVERRGVLVCVNNCTI